MVDETTAATASSTTEAALSAVIRTCSWQAVLVTLGLGLIVGTILAVTRGTLVKVAERDTVLLASAWGGE